MGNEKGLLQINPPIHTPIEVQPLGLPGQVPTTPVLDVTIGGQ